MEQLMQYVWQHRLWPQTHLHTVDGLPVQIIDPGRLNTDSGPDFFNAKIVIDGHMWAGDVEIHVRASDWHRHGHDNDPAYDSVILHIVDRDDTAIKRSNGEIIPQMQMACTPDFNRRYSELVDRADRDIPCAQSIAEMPQIYIADWIESLAFERIYDKTTRIESLLERSEGDWETACYATIARGLGFGVNGDPFERLALATPLMFIGRHCDSLTTIEALLFGQSGLLDPTSPTPDSYAATLQREFAFLAHKFNLRPLQAPGWKMARMRPANFPHRRIATLAALLHGGTRMMGRLLEIRTPDDAYKMFAPPLTGYWCNRYSFGAPTVNTGTALSRTSINGLIINAVVPLQYAYALAHDDSSLADRAIALLESLPPERNVIIESFANAGLKSDNAFTSQGIIQLRRAYCETRKCLYCRIGHRMLTSKCPRE